MTDVVHTAWGSGMAMVEHAGVAVQGRNMRAAGVWHNMSLKMGPIKIGPGIGNCLSQTVSYSGPILIGAF